MAANSNPFIHVACARAAHAPQYGIWKERFVFFTVRVVCCAPPHDAHFAGIWNELDMSTTSRP
jgi:hypothetical protein